MHRCRMQTLVDYFANITSAHRSFILVGGLTFFMLLESGLPNVRAQYSKLPHAGVNLFFTVTTVLVNFLMASVLVAGSDWAVANQFGVLRWLPAMPLWISTILGLMMLDLIGAYAVHRVEHKVRWMWRFHLIHHTDTHVDTTTANRHHPGESVFRFVFTAAAIMLAGAPVYLIFLYQSLSLVLSQFNHANIRLPLTLDRALSWLIVTPGMHRVHHHHVLPHTDSNYGNIFAIWDRLFGTFSKLDDAKIVFGIDTHPDAADHSRLSNLLKIPFQKYRAPTRAQVDKR
jgi:sterol desaturase/sphingolipid hydroxylase (fatty acid hydroxylase superfamily)